jgi:hypothetical protein
MVDHERTDYQPIRVMVEGQQRWAYLPHITTTNANRRRRFRRRQQKRNNGSRVSRATSPMQFENECQQSMATSPLPPTKSDGMWWDDEMITTARDTSADNDLQHNDHTPAPRPSADMVEHYLTSIRQEAELSTQAPAPSTSHRQQFCEWAERRSNADPLTPPVRGSGEEATHLPARRPLNPPPSQTSTNQHVADTSSTDIPANIVLQQLYLHLANGRITVSQGIDDRVYLVVQDPSIEQWDQEYLKVPQPPTFLQRYGMVAYDPLN